MKINTQQKSVKRANTKLWTLLPELLALVNSSEKTNVHLTSLGSDHY